MSAYSEIETQMTDRDCLVAGLQEMGYQPNVYDTPQQLTGYQGDKRKQTAEVIIPRSQVGGASNDVGYKMTENGTFKAIVSEYDSGYHFNAAKQKLVEAKYAVQKNLKICKKKGYKIKSSERKLVNGRWAVVTKARA